MRFQEIESGPVGFVLVVMFLIYVMLCYGEYFEWLWWSWEVGVMWEVWYC